MTALRRLMIITGDNGLRPALGIRRSGDCVRDAYNLMKSMKRMFNDLF